VRLVRWNLPGCSARSLDDLAIVLRAMSALYDRFSTLNAFTHFEGLDKVTPLPLLPYCRSEDHQSATLRRPMQASTKQSGGRMPG